jgi:hypothetical protein
MKITFAISFCHYHMVAAAVETVPAIEVDMPFVRNRLLEE